jgi:hypothetical protein
MGLLGVPRFVRRLLLCAVVIVVFDGCGGNTHDARPPVASAVGSASSSPSSRAGEWSAFAEPSGAFHAEFPQLPTAEPLTVAGHEGQTWSAVDPATKATVAVAFLNAPGAEGLESVTNKEQSLRTAGVQPEVGVDNAGHPFVQYDQTDAGTRIVGRWVVTENRTFILDVFADASPPSRDAVSAAFNRLLNSFSPG